MTRKEFITNIIRDLGFEILEYESQDWGVGLRVRKNGKEEWMQVWSDRSRCNPDRVSVKFKWCRLLNAEPDSYKAVETMRKVRVWLSQRGFEAVVDWPKYQPFSRGGWIRTENGYLRIRSIGFPWDQCAKAMTNKEALEDGLTTNKRFKPIGVVF